MPRQLRSENIVSDIAVRFSSAVDEHLGLSTSELSRRLGYANPSTLMAIKNGLTLPDFARLSEYKAVLKDGGGRVLNLHWVITGEGVPLLGKGAKTLIEQDAYLNNDIIIRISKLNSKKRAALMKFLADFE
jgi:hypothetical protein